MTKRLLLLNGLAVLMVPLHHSSSFGFQAMFLWANRYRPVSVPNYDMLGSLPYHILMFIRQVDAYAIPAFFFVSGFFIAFMARSRPLTVRSVLPRIKVFLIPAVIWTVVRFLLLQRPPNSIIEVFDTYYFVVLLIQYYLLSIILVPAAKANWKFFLVAAGIIQLASESPFYLKSIGVDFPSLTYLTLLTPRWFAPSRIFFFSLGLVAGLNFDIFKPWLEKNKWYLLALLVISGILSFIEYDFLNRISGQLWIGPNNPGLSRIVYATTFSLCFLAFYKVEVPFSNILSDLGSRSLGIYMMNIPAVYFVASLLYKFTPWMLGNQLYYQLILIITGMGIPLLLMAVVRRSPVRTYYRYLFG